MWPCPRVEMAKFTAGDTGVIDLFSEPAAGRTPKQIAKDLIKRKFPDAKIAYEIPNAMVGYQPGYGEVADSWPSGTSNSYTASVSYNNGPFSAMAVYVDGGKSGTVATTSSNVDLLPVFKNFRAANFGASYDFGVVKAFGQYTQFKYYADGLFDSAVDKAKVWQLGVSIPVTAAGSVLASYGQSKFQVVNDDDYSSKILSLGYDHALSKRTSVFAAYTSEKITDEKSGRAIAVGVKHSF